MHFYLGINMLQMIFLIQTKIYLDQICIESRERVNYTEYVYDPNIALGKKENAHSGAKKKGS